jgi:hypothetical protein
MEQPTTPTRSVTPPTAVIFPQSTPVKTGISFTNPFTTNQKFCIETRTLMGKEMSKFLVGPMPPDKFLDDFFPVDDLLPGLNTVPGFVDNCYRNTVIARKETRAYMPFVSQFS